MDKQETNVESMMKRILNEIRPDIDFEVETNLIADGVLESLDVVEIVARVEDELKIVIPSTELLEENFNSLDNLIKMCTRILGEK